MKKVLLLLLVLVSLAAFFVYKNDLHKIADRWLNFSFCDQNVGYKLGYVDPKFNKSSAEVLDNIKLAGELWNDMSDKNLFAYDPQADLEISLVFDERQSTLNAISEQKTNVDIQKEVLDDDVENFDKKRQELENKLNDLNEEIQYWNERGGASKRKYIELTNRQQVLQQEIDQINKMAESLNIATEKINQKVDTVNQEVENFNSLLSVKPEEGIYMAGSNKIEIYIYETYESFIHTTAHELGHALGLDHVDEEHSIMYPVSSPQSHASDSDRAALSLFCSQQNRLDLIRNDLKNLWYILLAQLDFVVT